MKASWEGATYIQGTVIQAIDRQNHVQGRQELVPLECVCFFQVCQVLDSEIWRLRGQGLGAKLKKAEPLTSDEDALWQKGALGDHHTPQCLLDTLIFCIGMNFPLRSGDEHHRLRFHPCQIEAKQDENGQQYLLYTEHVSKNHRGGLVDSKVKPKQVVAITNINNPERRVVRLHVP